MIKQNYGKPIMYIALARIKGLNMDWRIVTNFGEQFACEKGLMQLMVEKISTKNPQNEYMIKEIKNGN